MARPALIFTMPIGDGRVEPVTIHPARFDLWYAEFRSPLRAYLARITNRAAEADDLFQETWIRFLTHPPCAVDSPSVRAYLFTIATRLARDAWRRESWITRWFRAPRRSGDGEEVPDRMLAVAGDRASTPQARFEAREDVTRALTSVTARERALLWLAHVEQYEHREIAAILGIRAESVRVLLHRARRRALAALRDPEEEERGSP